MFEFTRLTGAGAAAALHALVFGEGERGARFTRPTQNGKYTASLTGTRWSRR